MKDTLDRKHNTIPQLPSNQGEPKIAFPSQSYASISI